MAIAAPESLPAVNALVVGATGLVGGELVRRLAGDDFYRSILVLARRALPPELALPRVETRIVDFERLADQADAVVGDHVFCALGTTIKVAGSRERFRAVDYGYPLALARLARRNGARHFSLVSALGASPGSRVFYNRVKGELEAAVRALDYPSGAIFRPSMLGGERTERRRAERVGQWLAALLPGRLRLVQAAAVAAAMAKLAREEAPGWRVVESEEIRRIARGGARSR